MLASGEPDGLLIVMLGCFMRSEAIWPKLSDLVLGEKGSLGSLSESSSSFRQLTASSTVTILTVALTNLRVALVTKSHGPNYRNDGLVIEVSASLIQWMSAKFKTR